MQDDSESFFISDVESGERLDKILANRLKDLGSRTYFQFLIDEGQVLLNGEPVKKRVKPLSGDEIEIEYRLTPELNLKPENIPLNIIFEDEFIIVVNKPPGMVVHPAVGNWTGTFVNALLYHCSSLLNKDDSNLRPGIVHRLDKDTSGLIIAAKTSEAHKKLVEMFSLRDIHKEYLAICLGNPGEGSIDLPIGRHPVQRKMMTVLQQGGKPALTHFRSLAHDEKLSLVSLIIETGRTHQIRVHMKHKGTPVLGDLVYGVPSANTKYGTTRQLLHAHKLSFKHPINSNLLNFQAEMPEEMLRFAEKLRFNLKLLDSDLLTSMRLSGN